MSKVYMKTYGNPACGITKSSFKTLKLPKAIFFGLKYPANEKWNLDIK